MKIAYVAGPYRAPTVFGLTENIQRAREVAALAGLATVLLVYSMGKRVESRTAGFIAALALLGLLAYLQARARGRWRWRRVRPDRPPRPRPCR